MFTHVFPSDGQTTSKILEGMSTSENFSMCKQAARLTFLTLMLLGLTLLPPAVTAQTAYTLTILPTLGGPSNRADAINDRGEIAGSSDLADGSTHAFLYSGGTVKDLGTLGGSNSAAIGLNNLGAVVGSADTGQDAFTTHAFVYRNSHMQDLGVLAVNPYSNYSQANSINDLGQIVGSSTIGTLNQAGTALPTHAFFYNRGTMRDLGTLGGDNSEATSINDFGQIVGGAGLANGTWHSFEYNSLVNSTGRLLDLGTLGGASTVTFEAKSINLLGEIAGASQRADGAYHAFLYTPGVMRNGAGITQDLGAIYFTSGAWSINNRNYVVGYSFVSNTSYHAILYKGGQILIDLNSFLPAGSPWVLKVAKGINDLGQIVGIARPSQSDTNDAPERAFILSPK
jgi:probable HAF family extracellular repeat protein